MEKVKSTGWLFSVVITPPEVTEIANTTSPMSFQNHSLGGCTIRFGFGKPLCMFTNYIYLLTVYSISGPFIELPLAEGHIVSLHVNLVDVIAMATVAVGGGWLC